MNDTCKITIDVHLLLELIIYVDIEQMLHIKINIEYLSLTLWIIL